MSFQEYRLLSLLEKQFPWMATSYRENIESLAIGPDQHPRLVWHLDDSRRLFFRVDLDLPALIVLSEPLSRFRAYRQYVVPVSAERSYYAQLELVPAYLANLNRICCVNFWGKQASNFLIPYSQPLRGKEDVVWRLDADGKSPIQFSSMNFLLTGNAKESTVPDSIKGALSNYLKYAFWSYPKKGFSCNAHMIHSRDNISHILKVARGIYLITDIGKPRREEIAPKYEAWVQRVELMAITSREVKPFWAYIARDVVQMIEQKTGSEGSRDLLINGMIYEFKDKFERPSGSLRLLSVVADFLPSDMDAYATLAAQSAAERFNVHSETLGSIGTVEELKEEVGNRYRLLSRHASVDSSLFGRLGAPMKYIVDELFPVVVQDDQHLYFIHPVIISALLKLGVGSVVEDRNCLALAKFVRLAEKLKVEKQGRLRTTEEAEYFRKLGIAYPDLLNVLLIVMHEIWLSKSLHKYC